jgi:hypothetical protein
MAEVLQGIRSDTEIIRTNEYPGVLANTRSLEFLMYHRRRRFDVQPGQHIQ